MAEIRLICPGCAAEYRLDAGAIPPRGREVECSACGRIWHATPPEMPTRDRLVEMTARAHAARDGASPKAVVRTIPLPPPAAPPAPAGPPALPPAAAAPALPAPPEGGPRLNRPLPADVLAILTEEAERERALRAGRPLDAPARGPAARPAPEPVPEPAFAVAPPHPPMPRPGRSAPLAEAASLSPAMPEAPALTPRAVPVPTPYHAPDPAPRARSGAFWWGLAIPLVLLGLYLLSGAFPADHPVTQALAPVRTAVDQARAWLAGLAP